MAGKFKVKAVTNLDNVTVGQEIQESDYSTLTPNGNFVQLEYQEDQEIENTYKIEPGIYTIIRQIDGLHLAKTSFTSDNILEDFVNTKEIEEKVECFFRNIHKYKDLGFEIAKRNMLLYGSAGTGKSTSIGKVCNKYVQEGKTAVVLFPTEKFEAYMVKDFIKTFEYVGVERFILVMEDIGGIEIEEVRRGSDSGLLSLLDNQEKTLKIPTLIIATTNFPETFMANLTNRPGRFDDKIKVPNPSTDARIKLMEFFVKRELTDHEKQLLSNKAANELSPAHIKEIVVRSIIHEKELIKATQEVMKEIEDYNKGFRETNRLGL